VAHELVSLSLIVSTLDSCVVSMSYAFSKYSGKQYVKDVKEKEKQRVMV
jgi:hypothetical protein